MPRNSKRGPTSPLNQNSREFNKKEKLSDNSDSISSNMSAKLLEAIQQLKSELSDQLAGVKSICDETKKSIDSFETKLSEIENVQKSFATDIENIKGTLRKTIDENAILRSELD